MNKLKKYTSIIVFLTILGAGSFGIYWIQGYVSSFSARVVEINTKLQELEAQKTNNELFKKFLSKGSEEQKQIDAYLLSGDEVFNAITNLEKEGKKTGLFNGESLGIMSVAKRENVSLKKMNAGEVVITIGAEGRTMDVNAYVKALSNLPYASYVEKLNTSFSGNKSRQKATITLILTEML